MVAAIIGKTLRTRLALDRLQSLFHLPVMETQTDLTQLDLQLRSLHSGMHPSGCDRRRKLLKEGCALLTFVLKVSPSSTLLRRYVKVVEQLRNGQSLDLPRFVLAYPIFLSLFKKTDWSDLNIGEEFIWRLDAATILAEATPLGARRFWGRDHGSGVLGSFLSITKACVCEFFWKMLRISIFPLIRSYLRSEKAEL